MTEDFNSNGDCDPYEQPPYQDGDEYKKTEYEPKTTSRCYRASRFRIGDVVTMKGGEKQELNVANVNHIYCVVLVAWFKDGRIHDAIIPEACLVPCIQEVVIDNPYSSNGSE